MNAVCLNNIVATEKGSLFDLLKKIKHARQTETVEGLSEKNKKVLAFNQVIILLKMEKIQECEQILKQMKEEFPSNVEIELLEALVSSAGNDQEQYKRIEQVKSKHPNDLLVNICFAQILINKREFEKAYQILISLKDLEHKPGLVHSLVSLNSLLGRTKESLLVYESAEKYWSTVYEKDTKNSEIENIYLLVLRNSAKFKLDNNFFQESAKSYEKILRVQRGDVDGLANYIIATSKYDPSSAEQYEDKLPPIEGVQLVDVEKLIKEAFQVQIHPQKKVTSSTSTPSTSSTPTISSSDPQKQDKKKKKNKKKVRLPKGVDPKNLDPNPKIDPERWIPLKDRSYYKDKRSKKGSAQGEVQRTTSVKIEVNSKNSKNKKKRRN